MRVLRVLIFLFSEELESRHTCLFVHHFSLYNNRLARAVPLCKVISAVAMRARTYVRYPTR